MNDLRRLQMRQTLTPALADVRASLEIQEAARAAARADHPRRTGDEPRGRVIHIDTGPPEPTRRRNRPMPALTAEELANALAR